MQEEELERIKTLDSYNDLDDGLEDEFDDELGDEQDDEVDDNVDDATKPMNTEAVKQVLSTIFRTILFDIAKKSSSFHYLSL